MKRIKCYFVDAEDRLCIVRIKWQDNIFTCSDARWGQRYPVPRTEAQRQLVKFWKTLHLHNCDAEIWQRISETCEAIKQERDEVWGGFEKNIPDLAFLEDRYKLCKLIELYMRLTYHIVIPVAVIYNMAVQSELRWRLYGFDFILGEEIEIQRLAYRCECYEIASLNDWNGMVCYDFPFACLESGIV